MYDLCIVGGAGHVGLPLALVFAKTGLKVHIYDINQTSLDTISSGIMPFMESGAEELLSEVLADGNLTMSADVSDVSKASRVILTIGTPVDEFHNPVLGLVRQCIDDLLPNLKDGQLLILRSTVYPGTTDWLASYLESKGRSVKVSFCPERVVQGHSIEELQHLPQIVSGTSEESVALASQLFSLIAPEIVELKPIEAEFAKLMNNAYRYIEFAIANQFYMITSQANVDYERVLTGMKQNYPRAKNIPMPGFAAGPCLFKDTMQLSAFSNNQFSLGHAAMLVNEGLVLYVVDEISKKYPLHEMTIGLLGMAFKAESDDIRSSLSYKLKKVLQFKAKHVLTTDPYVSCDEELLPMQDVVAKSDLLILCVPHKAYKQMDLSGKPLVDIWNFVEPKVIASTIH